MLEVIARPLGTGVGEWLTATLRDPQWKSFRCAVAFLTSSGSAYFAPALYDFTRRDGTAARVAVGIDAQGTTLEGLQDVWRVLDGSGELWIVHEGPRGVGSFHPKVYLFESDSRAVLVAGSANLTLGGLFRNHELSILLEFDDLDHPALLAARAALDAWQTAGPSCLAVDAGLIVNLHARDELPSEAAQRVARRISRVSTQAANGLPRPADPFGTSALPQSPPPPPFPVGLPAAPVSPTSLHLPSTVSAPPVTSRNRASRANPVSPHVAAGRRLVMEVVPHDNGEVFLSKRAVADDPAFFGHPFAGWSRPKRLSNPPYPQMDPQPIVEIVIYDNSGNVMKKKVPHLLYVVEYVRKSEIRMTIPDRMHDYIPWMSLMVMTRDPNPYLDYRLEFYPPSTAPVDLLQGLINVLPSGGSQPRRYGWV